MLALATLLTALGTLASAVAALVGVWRTHGRLHTVEGKVDAAKALAADTNAKATSTGAAVQAAAAVAADTNAKAAETAEAVETVRAIVVNGGSPPAAGAPAGPPGGA